MEFRRVLFRSLGSALAGLALRITEQRLFQRTTLFHIGITWRSTLAATPGFTRSRFKTTTALTSRHSRFTFSQLKVDLALVQIDAHDLDLNAIAQTETATTALARQTVMHGVEM